MTPVACIVTGSREWADNHTIRVALETLPKGSIVIHGNRDGADKIAAFIARELGFAVQRFDAADYGKWPWCGPKRNAAMVRRALELKRRGYIPMCLAFRKPGGTGTPNCIEQARAQAIDVVETWDQMQPQERA